MQGHETPPGVDGDTSRDGAETPSRAVVMVERLEAAVAWLREHPDEKIYGVDAEAAGVRIRNFSVNSAEDIAEIVKRLGGRWDKDVRGEMFHATTTVAPGVVYELIAWRKDVCERIVVASREVTAEVPDPAMVAALPLVTTTELEEVVEWRCAPLLGRDAAEPVADDTLNEVPW